TNSPAYQLAAELEPNALGFNLSFESFVPTARRPEVQRRFQAHLTEQELLQLRWLIDDVLTACGAKKLDRPAERVMQVFPPGAGPHTGSLFLYFLALAKKRRLDALKKLAEERARLSLQDVAALVDVVRSSLQRFADDEHKETLPDGAALLGLRGNWIAADSSVSLFEVWLKDQGIERPASVEAQVDLWGQFLQSQDGSLGTALSE
ncbi:MAG: hypothetical protein J0L58_10145, partial [Burkholderiales bacterium]|nr:hypothetical protein [Burkholderiales bacterium]